MCVWDGLQYIIVLYNNVLHNLYIIHNYTRLYQLEFLHYFPHLYIRLLYCNNYTVAITKLILIIYTECHPALLSTIDNPNPSVGSSRLGKETVAGVAVAGFLLVVSLVFMALIILVCQIRVSRLKKTLAIDYQQTPRDAYNPVAISPAASTKSDEESTQGRQHAFVYQNENADCIDNIENKS